jgi:hypothetical protein
MAASKRKSVSSTPEGGRDGEHFASSHSGVQPACRAGDGDEIDHAFEKLESGAPPRGVDTEELWQDALSQLENAALLREMASEQLLLLSQRMGELAAGPTPKRWLGTVRLLLRSLLKAAETLDEPELVPALAGFDLLLERASRMPGAVLDQSTRAALLASHARLVTELTRAFEPFGALSR